MATTGRAVRLADVANLAGVGTSIASRVLNGDPTVSIRPETRERILHAAETLNYRPNAMARGLRLSRTMTIGIIINLSFYYDNAEILIAVERAAAAAGYLTLIADTADFVGRGEAYSRLLYERRVDGLLIASILVDDKFVRELRQEGLPFVLLHRRVRGAGPSASVDDARGMRMAVDHLVGLGHTQIGYVAGPVRIDPASRRLAGFRAGMRAAGLPIRSEFVRPCAIEAEAVFRATEDLLGRRPRPTALIVWSPTGAVPALAAVRQSALRLPEDISMMSFSESPIARYLDPPLTTVHMPLDEMAEAGVHALLRIVDGEHPRSVVARTAPVLVSRASTGPPGP